MKLYTLYAENSPDLTNGIGLPLLLLAAVWGAFGPILKAIQMMNERRDKILDPKSKLTVSHRKLMLYSDWLAIMIATYVFAGFIGLLIIKAPLFVDFKSPEDKQKAVEVFEIVGMIFLATAGIGLITGVLDFVTLYKHLATLSPPGRSELMMVTFYGGAVNPATNLPANYHVYKIWERSAPWYGVDSVIATIELMTPGSPMPTLVNYVVLNKTTAGTATANARGAIAALPALGGLSIVETN
jgi:hypothetical protein